MNDNNAPNPPEAPWPQSPDSPLPAETQPTETPTLTAPPQPVATNPPAIQVTPAAKPAEQSLNELAKTLNNSQEILATASSVFPFNLFPDTVTLDREKVTITHRIFFKAAETITIRVEDILNVTINAGPLFGSLKLTSRFFNTNKPYAINYLRKSETIAMKQIIQGYTIAIQKKIDCSSLPAPELRTILLKLGQADESY